MMTKRTTAKYILSFLLALIMTMALVPLTVNAVGPSAPSSTATWNFTYVDADGSGGYGSGSWSWVQSAKTLTLNNINLSNTGSAALWLPSDSTIVLVGANTVRSTYNGTDYSWGIRCAGNLTITSSTGGSLTATGGTSTGNSSHGIQVGGANTLTVSGSANVTAAAGTGSTGSYGVAVSNGGLIVSGGTLTATGNTRASYNNYTVPNGYYYTVSVNTNGSSPTMGTSNGSFVVGSTHKYALIQHLTTTPPVNPNDTTTWDFRTVDVNGSDSYGTGSWSWVQSTKTLTLTNINFTTSATRIALHLPADTTIVLVGTNTVKNTWNGPSVTIGVICAGNLTITSSSGGNLTATGGTSTALESHGIQVGGAGTLTISGSANVTATAGTGSTGSYGVVVSSGDITVSGGTLTAAGGTRAINTNYTVPNGYKYTVSVNANGSSPTTGTSNGSLVVGSTHKYARIEYAAPPVNYTLRLVDYNGRLYKNNMIGDEVTTEMAAKGAVVTGSAGARILTLTNFNFSTSAEYYAIDLPAGTTIVLNGSNTVNSTYNGSLFAYGVRCDGALTITSSSGGSLTAKGGSSTGSGSTGISVQIGAGNRLTISGNANVTAIGGAANTDSCGIFAGGGFTVSGTANVTATGGTGKTSYGVGSGVTASGGTLTASGGTCAIRYNFTVPNGYTYTVSANENGSSPTTGTSDGSFVVGSTHKYAKIEAPPSVLPVITSQPANRTITASQTTTFSITATGADSYRWQYSYTTDGITWSAWGNVPSTARYSGQTTATLSVINSPVSSTQYRYRCVVSNAVGSVNSNSATLTVSATPAAPVITSANKKSVVSGAGGTFQVTATGTNPIAYSLTGAPTGVTINSTSGLITIAGTVAVNTHTFTITASNGTTPNATQNFTLTVTATFVPVTSITGVPATGTAGTSLTLAGTVAPSGATNQTIVWSVKNAGATGAVVSGNVVTTTGKGMAVFTATIADGLGEGSDYVQDFTIEFIFDTRGDANEDGLINAADAAAILRHLVQLKLLTPQGEINAKVTSGTGPISAADAARILRWLVQLELNL
ncbi:MAG: hypothetical protein FWE69_01785 [Clostridiales bacterium]|nr:hypothetical protein [Clostridiales bacterium]